MNNQVDALHLRFQTSVTSWGMVIRYSKPPRADTSIRRGLSIEKYVVTLTCLSEDDASICYAARGGSAVARKTKTRTPYDA